MFDLLHMPDWPGPVEETLVWGVSRRRSRDGSFERVELVAPWPARLVRTSAWADVLTDRNALDLASTERLIPWLPGRSRITSSESDTEFNLGGDPTARGFVVGESALLETADGEREVVTVGAVASTLHITGTPTLTVGTGTTIMPLLAAYLEDDQISVVRASPSGGSMLMTWRVDDTQHDGADDAEDEDWTIALDGVDVLTRVATSNEAHLVASERFGGIGGAWLRVVPGAGQTLITQQHVFLSALEILDLRRWLYRRRGPLTPCWVPLGLSLGSCVVETHESLAVLEVDDPGSTTVHDDRQAILAWPTTGDPTAHRVGAILRFGDATVPEGRAWLIGLDPPLAHSTVRAAQWLVHSRLSETVTLSWFSPEAAAVTLQWASTPEEVA